MPSRWENTHTISKAFAFISYYSHLLTMLYYEVKVITQLCFTSQEMRTYVTIK